MKNTFRTIGLWAKQQDERVAGLLPQLLAPLAAAGCTVLAEPDAAALLPEAGLPTRARAELGAACDLVLVVGGDGTMLTAARSLAPHGVPLVGVNAGRLGFLTDLPADTAVRHLEQILAGDYQAEQRFLLTMQVLRQGKAHAEGLALNDVVVQKWDGGRMIEFESRVNDVFVCAHRADGIVIATPTGSTAYALSSGGPIVHPDLAALTLVPICPHTLSDRPVVVDGSAEIDIVLQAGRGLQAHVSCDGQASVPLENGDRVRISRAAQAITLLHPRDYDYFAILRNKLHWGRSRTEDIGR